MRTTRHPDQINHQPCFIHLCIWNEVKAIDNIDILLNCKAQSVATCQLSPEFYLKHPYIKEE
jgi:hypothetical protein